MLHSGSFLSLGGGDPVQRRDMKGEGDDEGFITVAPVEDPKELDDNVDLLFTDVTDWSIVDPKAQSPYRYNERELVRSWAENCPASRRFLMDNYVRFTRISGTHGGGGLSRARGARCFLMLGDKTEAGTITAEDAGVAARHKFAPVQMLDASRSVGPNGRCGGRWSRPGRRARVHASSCAGKARSRGTRCRDVIFETLFVSNPIRQGADAWFTRAALWDPETPSATVSREPGRPRRLHLKDRRGAGTGPEAWTSHLASDGANRRCRMVPPGEGNEARGDGRRGVGSTAEAGELSPRAWREGGTGRWHRWRERRPTHRGWVPSPRHDNG